MSYRPESVFCTLLSPESLPIAWNDPQLLNWLRSAMQEWPHVLVGTPHTSRHQPLVHKPTELSARIEEAFGHGRIRGTWKDQRKEMGVRQLETEFISTEK
jgi:hypothetical protein